MSTTAERGSENSPRRRRRSRPGDGDGGRGGGGGGGARRGGGGLPLFVVAGALIVSGVGAIIVSSSFDTPHKARALGPNLAINDGASNPLDLTAINSPTLVRNPVEQDNLVTAARIDSPEYSCSLNASYDGGGRWTQTPIPAPRGETGAKCFAPDAAFSSDGTLYVSYVTLKGRANAPDAVWITRSTDGGKTLKAPVETPLGKRAFQVRLTADPRSPKRIFLTWLKADELGLYTFSNTGYPIMAIRSDDGGVNWTEPSRVSSSSRPRVVAPSPAAGRAGELNVLYLDLGNDALDYGGGHRGRGGAPYAGEWELVLARSTDNGATWKESVAGDAIKPTERFIVFTPPHPSIAVDRDSGKVYAAFQDGKAGDPDVMLWSLEGGGSEWSSPVRVNDTPQRDGTAQYRPQLSVAPNGRLDVVYYDRRADRTNVLNEVSLQASFDDGKTFTPRVNLSDRAFSSRIGSGLERGLPDLGSRLGLVSTDSRAYAVWADARGGSVRTAKQDLARGVVAFNDPPRLSSAAETALRIGGVVLILMGLLALPAVLVRRRQAA